MGNRLTAGEILPQGVLIIFKIQLIFDKKYSITIPEEENNKNLLFMGK